LGEDATAGSGADDDEVDFVAVGISAHVGAKLVVGA
jgi:hypothetical protein